MTSSQLVAARLCALAGAAALAACAAPLPPAGGLAAACTLNADCAAPFTCVDGKCAVSAPAGGCDPGFKRCNGDDVEVCEQNGQGWQTKETCELGCKAGACAAQVCTPSTFRCNGNALETCVPNGGGYGFVQYCPDGCDATKGACTVKPPPPPPEKVCNAGDRRCSNATIEQCMPDGQGWGFVNFCQYGCDDKATTAACAAPPPTPAPTPVCTAGDTRCNGSALEECRPDGMAYAFVQFCPTACTPKTTSAPAQCAPAVCRPFATSCDPSDATHATLLTCNANGTGTDASSCTTDDKHPGVCEAGACRPVTCTPGAKSCSNDGTVQTCNALGTGSTTTDTCAHGCQNGACLAASCNPGDRRCNGTAIEACLPDGSGYAFVEYCATSCTGTAPQASCAVPTCAPLTYRCGGTGGNTVQVCLGDGSGYATVETCNGTCQDGQCQASVAPKPICTANDLRCSGEDVQKCAADGMSWGFVQSCFGICSAGACDAAGACGGSLDSSGRFSPGLTLTAPVSSLPADGNSTTLVVSNVIVDAAGHTVADGTTFTVSTSAGTITSADADPATAGLQVKSFNGRIHFIVKSATATGTATVRAAWGLSTGCAGSVNLTFTTPGATFFQAEDFTVSTRKDAVASTAPWYNDFGYVDGSLALDFGSGRDGDLTVPAGTTWDITANRRPNHSQPDAVNFQVLALGSNYAIVDGFVDGLAPGDEVILINLQGSSSFANNVGNYEILTVSSAQANGIVEFEETIQKLYGNTTANSDLSQQHVMLQRIPHYGNVTLPAAANTVLTAGTWNGTLGGLLFFKATGTVSVGAGARIDMVGRGYRGGSGYQVGESYGGYGTGGAGYGTSACCSYATGGTYNYGSPSLSRLFLGSGGGAGSYYYSSGNGGEGGGAIVVWAANINVAGVINDDGGAASYASGTGSGGTVFLRGASVTLGSSLVTARPGAYSGSYGGAGGPGRIRVDSLGGSGSTTPAYNAGFSQKPAVQSLDIDTTGATNILNATLAAVVSQTTGGTIDFAISGDGTNFAPAVPGTQVNFVSGLPGAGQTGIGTSLRWRALFTPTSAEPLRLFGVVWQYKTQ